MVSAKHIHQLREPGCWAILADKKDFEVGNSFIKRSLRRHEWQIIPGDPSITVVPPTTLPQRFANDTAVLKYLAEKAPSIPLPPFQCVFEDDGGVYHATGRVEGVSTNELSQEDKLVVTQELLQHVATLRSLRSDTPGVSGETLLCPPMRITSRAWHLNYCWRPRGRSDRDELVFLPQRPWPA